MTVISEKLSNGLEEFAKNKLVLIYDFDEYVQQRKKSNKKRILGHPGQIDGLTYMYIKCFFMGFIDDIRIRLLIQDYSLLSNGNRLLYTMLS